MAVTEPRVRQNAFDEWRAAANRTFSSWRRAAASYVRRNCPEYTPQRVGVLITMVVLAGVTVLSSLSRETQEGVIQSWGFRYLLVLVGIVVSSFVVAYASRYVAIKHVASVAVFVVASYFAISTLSLMNKRIKHRAFDVGDMEEAVLDEF